MRAGLRWLRIVPNLLRHRRFERGLDEELQATLDQLVDEKVAQGLSPAEARRQALLDLGGLDQVKEAVRDVRSGALVEQLGQDAFFALRALRRAKGFALVAVLTLAFGIGGTTAIFSVLRAAIADPEYPDAARLVHLWAYWPGGSGNFGYPDFQAIVEQNRSFAGLAAYESWGGVALSGAERPVTLKPSFVTSDYFELLGATPQLGRVFVPHENEPTTAQPVAILSHACWQRQFGADGTIVGRAVRLNGSPYTVVGVLAPGFRDLGLAEGGAAPDVWLPAAAAPPLLGQPPLTDPYSIYWGVARLRPGVTLVQARQNLAEVAARRARESPTTRAQHGLDVQPLRERMTGPVRRPALLLFAGAGLILMLGCMNLANALLVRLGRRWPEMAVRSALGASSARLVQQLLVEAGVLALVGGVAGSALALVLTRALGAWVRDHVSALVDAQVDAAALVCPAVLTIATLALFGLIPALAGRRVDLRTALVGAAATGASDGRARLRRGLVVAEVALSMMLLVGAGLMVRSAARLLGQGLGFDPKDLLTFRVDLNGARYSDPAARARFVRAFEERLRAVPGVRSVTILGPSMLGNATWVMSVFPREYQPRGPDDFLQVFRHSVNPGALANLGIPLLRGREFDDHDTAEAPLVAIVSESVARQFWAGENVVGRQLRRPDPSQPAITVIGVAADAQHRNRYSLDDLAAGIGPCGMGPQRDVYLAYAQRANPSLTAALRITGAPGTLSPAVERALAAVDPDLPLNDVAMLADRLAAQEGAPTAIALLFAGFAAFALFLTALGLYSVVAQSVDQRAREIGIRITLGARPVDILRRFVGGGAALALAGAALGAIGALVLVRLMASLLFGIDPYDPVTFVTVATALLMMALVASFIPSHRVLRRGPMQALREQ